MTLFSGLPVERVFKEISVEECPGSVLETVQRSLESGHIERVLVGRASRRPCYFVEVEISENHATKLQISDDGTLVSQVDAMRESELPRTVKTAVTDFLKAGARFDTADHVLTTESEEFHVELDLGDNLDLHLFLDESGVVLRQHEVGDF